VQEYAFVEHFCITVSIDWKRDLLFVKGYFKIPYARQQAKKALSAC